MKGSPQCDFCDEFSGGHDNAFSHRYADDPSDRILFATENFAVLPSLGQIVEGYLLIVPREHFRTLADVGINLMRELVNVKSSVQSALSASYGPSAFFEHGARSERSGGCGIYHAHLHAVPLRQEMAFIARLNETFALKPISGVERIGDALGSNGSYLYYQDFDAREYATRVDHLPSQYMRKLLADMLGQNNWDWRECGREDALLSTLDKLAASFGSQASSCASPTTKASHEEAFY
ncbi:MAG TPA: HIT domain-containing protein [Terriglobia bacterium]|nr:HIT domain-containing protein [Terriglobia bacterium]